MGRGGEAWYFYVVLLFGEEWPVLLLAAVGAVIALRRPTLLRVFLIWAFAVSLIVYSWAGEKFAWLVLHPLLPLLLPLPLRRRFPVFLARQSPDVSPRPRHLSQQ